MKNTTRAETTDNASSGVKANRATAQPEETPIPVPLEENHEFDETLHKVLKRSSVPSTSGSSGRKTRAKSARVSGNDLGQISASATKSNGGKSRKKDDATVTTTRSKAAASTAKSKQSKTSVQKKDTKSSTASKNETMKRKR